MAKKENFWVSQRNNGDWAVKREGSSKATALHGTQSEAWKDAKRRARGAEGEAFLKGKNGKIRSRNTYGEDPYPPKG